MKNNYTFIDLFAGCGGLSEGFYQSQFKALTHIEFDKYSCETLRLRMKHYGYSDKEISVLEKDILDKNIINSLKDQIGSAPIDVIIGGPPCQSFSSLGRAKDENGMKEDPRNFLFESYEKILNHFSPKIFVFENVMGLLTARLGEKKTVDIIIERLGKNYNLINDPKKMVLNSCNFGVPQIRERVFLIGVNKKINLDPKDIYARIEETHYNPKSKKSERKTRKKFITVRDALADLPVLKPGHGKTKINHKINRWNPFLKKIRKGDDVVLLDHVARNHNTSDRERYKEMSKNRWTFKELLEKKPYLNHKKQRVFNNSYVVQLWDRPSRTIIAHLYKDGNQFIHPDSSQERTLTVREAARLQSFDDNFIFAGSRTQQYKQIGNAVPPFMSKAIAKSIKLCLDSI